MAAEAFLVQDEATGQLKLDLKTALKEGNNHNSKFTDPQADKFLAHWQVVAQKPNTTTGFSGTLFKCTVDDPATGAKVGELVMPMRSTEYRWRKSLRGSVECTTFARFIQAMALSVVPVDGCVAALAICS
ncbi:hypothetical protein MIZ03_2500 [Rhodoferax lithotrophicus]|uniref:Uncharacterized protein n=2 Tax=Rhodoferax lithotrophicus TaxID=2798804 RepID=A0ABM7MMV5_9BURK|nr:hypothetical protein MIZ03_2500 [Rhodoferax sp. MIZ03]